MDDFSRIPGGVPSIESRLAMVYSGLVSRATSDETAALQRWVDVCSTSPARLFGFSRKGQLTPGYDADIVIFDPEAQWVVSSAKLHETSGWTPYDGLALRGRAVVTISRGEMIADQGKWLGKAGRGRFVTRRG
jgi:dihydropyrimidinase